MAAAADDGATVATDVAEALVRDGVPFREAHRQVAERIAAGERFASPTAAEAAAARQPLDDLAAQLARARAALMGPGTVNIS
jgi:argininosuccinate lyase